MPVRRFPAHARPRAHLAQGDGFGAPEVEEAVSDSLRREVAPLGVQVVVVEPGGVRTAIAARGIATANDLAARMTPEQDARYGDLVRANNKLMASGTASGPTADAAALVIAKAVTARRPRTRHTAGRDAALIMRLGPMLSDRALDRVLAANLRRHQPKRAAVGDRVESPRWGREAGRRARGVDVIRRWSTARDVHSGRNG
ncbi:hypothetical protein ABT246_20250 [Streptomyces sp. NPDC001553]|uniref:hypothetical protein n=1 Tax=Streptomyces sp. NPDC001553 TaxID=3154385 RepID=UPI0033308190